jgi:restriction endonuclease S subunit
MRALTFFICALYYLIVPKFLCYVWDVFVVKQYFLPSISYKTMFALYISYLVEMPGFRKQIDELQAGSTVAYMSISMTKKLNIMVPPIELQNQFADFVKQVDKSKVAVQKALDETQILFDSLMQKYFG